MFLFRAINDRDLDHYLKGEGIYSSLLNSFYDRNNKEKKEQETILDCCYKYFYNEFIILNLYYDMVKFK